MIGWLLIGVILWVLIVGLYFVFNYGAHMNDPKDHTEAGCTCRNDDMLDRTKTGDQDE